MKVIRSFRTALERTVAQAVTIFSNDYDEILNSKSEWGYPRIPRLMVEVGDKIQEAQPSNQGPPATQPHQPPNPSPGPVAEVPRKGLGLPDGIMPAPNPQPSLQEEE